MTSKNIVVVDETGKEIDFQERDSSERVQLVNIGSSKEKIIFESESKRSTPLKTQSRLAKLSERSQSRVNPL